MLKPELARQQLTALKSSRHKEGRFARIKRLPKSAAVSGLGLLGRKPDGKPISDYQVLNATALAAAAHLESHPTDRARVLAALFPTLSAELEDGWQLFSRLPYTVGYDRRSFRAPKRPEAYRQRRQQWLAEISKTLGDFPDDALSMEWIAAWAVHLDDSDSLGYLLAAAIDRGGATGDVVFEIVKDSAAGRHDIGGPGRHATRALLCAARPEGWEFAENLLRAAQRQEGLRQNLLEAVDEAHPDAFRRMLALLLKENLLRFSSVARAAAVWLGEEESALEAKKLKSDLTQLHELLADNAKRDKLIDKGDALACYRGLWVVGYENIETAVRKATPILKDKNAASPCPEATLTH